MKCLAMLESADLGMALYVIFSFVLFISGLFLGASLSPNRRKQREPWHARLVAAEGGPRRDGKETSTKLLAVVTALIVVFGLIVLDHFKGPFLPDEFYCLSDGGITGKCVGRRGSPFDRATNIQGGVPLAE
jgi:hypothetical protein